MDRTDRGADRQTDRSEGQTDGQDRGTDTDRGTGQMGQTDRSDRQRDSTGRNPTRVNRLQGGADCSGDHTERADWVSYLRLA